ncbi:hypothetical protein YC2023_027734 [Brassica napus]
MLALPDYHFKRHDKTKVGSSYKVILGVLGHTGEENALQMCEKNVKSIRKNGSIGDSLSE